MYAFALLAALACPTGGGFDIQTRATEVRPGGVEVRDITFASAAGGRTEAFLVVPPKPRAGVLFVHWYEPPNPTSNRTQFVGEAVELAAEGVVSLLPATLWSDPSWFRTRNRADDLKNSRAQICELKRALDVLFGQPGVTRAAYVGHDFGAMFGAALAGIDSRPVGWVLMAGTPRFGDWYLFGPPMPQPARTEYLRSLEPIDPVSNIAKATPAPLFFQFATRDFYVPHDKAEEFWRAARSPKQIVFYDAVHGLNEQAREDRVKWISRVLRLTPSEGTDRPSSRTQGPPRE